MLKNIRRQESVAELYHENSKYFPSTVGTPTAHEFDPSYTARAFKTYRRVPVVPLPQEFPVGDLPIEEIIVARRSTRRFGPEPLTLENLSKVLFFSNGVTNARQHDGAPFFERAAPSAGALYPIEIYPVVLNIRNIGAGIYHFNVRDHTLELLRAGDFREDVLRLCLWQDFVPAAAFLLFMTSVFTRVKAKYGERGYRFALLDAGHIAENTYLIATGMRLGVVSIGGFIDDGVNDFLGIDGVEEAAVYATVIGSADQRDSERDELSDETR